MANINSKTVVTTSNNAGGQAATATITSTGNQETEFSQPVTGSTTNVAYALTLVKNKVNFLRIDSDVTLTIKTNSSGSPTDTISVTGGTPIIYPFTPLASIPLTADITANIYVTVPGSTSGTLTIYAVNAL